MMIRRMNPCTVLVGVFLLLCQGALLAGTEHSQLSLDEAKLARRVLYGVRAEQAPQLDGQGDDPCWKKAVPVTGFLLNNGAGLATQQTIARCVYDAEALYFLFRCNEDQMERIAASYQGRTKGVWTDDSVEIFLDTNHDRTTYLHFVANSVGASEDSLSGKSTWQVAASKAADHWNVEVRIPFFDLGLSSAPKRGDVWGVNLNRNEKPTGEQSSWTYTGPLFHKPQEFGELIFGAPELRVADVIPAALPIRSEKQELRLRVVSSAAEEQKVEVRLTVASPSSGKATYKRSVAISGGAEQWLKIRYDVKQVGNYVLDIRLANPATEEQLYRSQHRMSRMSQGICSAAWPQEKYNNVLYFAKGTVQHMFMIFADHSGKPVNGYELVLDLPKPLTLLDPKGRDHKSYLVPNEVVSADLVRDQKPYTRYVLKFSGGLPGNLADVRFFNGFLAWFGVDGNPDWDRRPLFYHLGNGKDVEPEHRIDVCLLDRPEASQPKLFDIGISGWTLSASLDKQLPSLLDTYKRIGVTAFQADGCNGPEGVAPELRRVNQIHARDMLALDGLWWFWWNDKYLKKHPDHKAVRDTGQPDPSRICPEILITTPEAFDIAKGVAQSIKSGVDYICWDLEGPHCFEVCFCSRCLSRFRKVARIDSRKELNAKIIKEQYRNQWVDFCCDQSARLCRGFERQIRSAVGRKGLTVYSGMPNAFTKEHYRVDWWRLGREVAMVWPSFYSANPGDLSGMFTSTASWIRAEFRKKAPSTKVWGHPAFGFQRMAADSLTLSHPEMIQLQIVKLLVAGYDGAFYWWWGPADGRFYLAIAKAARIVSECETICLKGKRDDTLAEVSGLNDGSYAAFTYGRKRAILLFNHSPDKPATVTVKPRLPQRQYQARWLDGDTINDASQVVTTLPPLDIRVLLIDVK